LEVFKSLNYTFGGHYSIICPMFKETVVFKHDFCALSIRKQVSRLLLN